MIFYFSATGNSRFVAKVLADHCQDELVCLNDYLKNNSKGEFSSEKPYVLVAPVYAWKIPARVQDFLAKASFSGNRKWYVVVTMGGSSGAAASACQTLLEQRGMEFLGFQDIRMPDNFLIADRMLEKSQAIEKIRASLPLIRQTAERISKGEHLPSKEESAKDRLLSGMVNWGFNHFMSKICSFTVSEQCVRCGRCVQDCPTGNIQLTDTGISFGDQCMFCLGCINQCPTHAIDCKGKGAQNGHYTCPSDEEILSER